LMQGLYLIVAFPCLMVPRNTIRHRKSAVLHHLPPKFDSGRRSTLKNTIYIPRPRCTNKLVYSSKGVDPQGQSVDVEVSTYDKEESTARAYEISNKGGVLH